MSMTIGANTVASPAYDDGWEREREQVGGGFRYLDGSRGRHHVTAQWRWSLSWRVKGADYTALMAALLAVEGTAFTLTDHLGNSETCELEGSPRDLEIGNGKHAVSATFVEVTA